MHGNPRPDSACLIGSQVMLRMLVPGPHSEQHCQGPPPRPKWSLGPVSRLASTYMTINYGR